MERIKFQTKSLFLIALRANVDLYFERSGKSKFADHRMWIKVSIFLSVFFGSYLLILSQLLSPLSTLLIAALLGMFSAFVGFNVCHDAIHGSFSKHKWVNRIFGNLFNLLGASTYIWKISHNAVHHTFTNIPGHDDDLIVAPKLIRIEAHDQIYKIQRYQHWYAFPLYALASFSWVFTKDFKKMLTKKKGQHQIKHPTSAYVRLFLAKAMYYGLFIVLPLLLLEMTWWQILIGFVVMHLAQGLTMGLVFQLAHVVEHTQFPCAEASGKMQKSWAEHQMFTTANFASNCKIAAFFLGGLNRQIEHHLFPGICHTHYREIGEIVKNTAKQYHLPYIENESFIAAIISHYRVLKKFAKEA